VRRFHLKRAVTIIGRFAFGGWILVTGILLIFACIAGAAGMPGLINNPFYSVFILLMYSLFGLFGGAVVGLLAAVLDRLFKLPARDTIIEAKIIDPSVWPPAPKPPK
jgi:hypothetical protein